LGGWKRVSQGVVPSLKGLDVEKKKCDREEALSAKRSAEEKTLYNRSRREQTMGCEEKGVKPTPPKEVNSHLSRFKKGEEQNALGTL